MLRSNVKKLVVEKNMSIRALAALSGLADKTIAGEKRADRGKPIVHLANHCQVFG